jgi:DNA-binding MarR family transcriptional regulator
MGVAPRSKLAFIERIVGQLARRHSTAAVLLHAAVAGRLDLGITDLKCLDLLRERGAMTSSELANLTGLTTGAITGVVARLERAGFLRRKPDARDGRKQVLHPAVPPGRAREIHGIFEPIHAAAVAILDGFDARQLAAIAEFLERMTEEVYRQVGSLRAPRLAPTSPASARSSRPRRGAR